MGAAADEGAGPGAARRVRKRQKRSSDKSRAIIDAAIGAIAAHGFSGLTHRLVARQAGVSTAATTYHFESKADIVHAACRTTLRRYDDALRRRVQSLAGEIAGGDLMRDHLDAIVVEMAGAGRELATCWGEFMLNAPRDPDDLALARDWFGRHVASWRDLVVACGAASEPEQQALYAVDVLVGSMLLVVGLGLTTDQVRALQANAVDLADLCPADAGLLAAAAPARTGRKSAATRGRILDAAIDLMRDEGSGVVSGRSVAERAGLTRAATTYYFPSVASLLAAAEHRLFLESKERYRQGLGGGRGADADIPQLIDRTAAVFLREATEFKCDSAVHYATWLRAGGHPALSRMLWEAAVDQHRSWRAVLARWNRELSSFDALLAQALFLGKLIRIIAAGSRIEDLARVRSEFAFGIAELVSKPSPR